MTRTAPRVKLFGGFHNDPVSRRQFLRQLKDHDKVHARPHFVAVESGPVLFAKYSGCRQIIADGLRGLGFLAQEERIELGKVFAWEADAYREVYPLADPVWLDDLPEHHGVSELGVRLASDLLADFIAAGTNAQNPARSKDELIDRVAQAHHQRRRKALENGWGPIIGERDERWAGQLCERIDRLQGGWIAVVIGWAHADPKGKQGNLCRLLKSKELAVEVSCSDWQPTDDSAI